MIGDIYTIEQTMVLSEEHRDFYNNLEKLAKNGKYAALNKDINENRDIISYQFEKDLRQICATKQK